MQTLQQIEQQIFDLQKQAEAIRRQEIDGAIQEVKRLVSLYNLSYADLGLSGAIKASAKAKKSAGTGGVASDGRTTVAPKYRDPDSGQTWTGRGKAPVWLANKLAAGASKESFRI